MKLGLDGGGLGWTGHIPRQAEPLRTGLFQIGSISRLLSYEVVLKRRPRYAVWFNIELLLLCDCSSISVQRRAGAAEAPISLVLLSVRGLKEAKGFCRELVLDLQGTLPPSASMQNARQTIRARTIGEVSTLRLSSA
jgi:hypothetical protein